MGAPGRICALVGAYDAEKPATIMTRPAFRTACKARQWVGPGKRLPNSNCAGCGIGKRVNENTFSGRAPIGMQFVTSNEFEELKKKVNVPAAIEKTKFFRKFQDRGSGHLFAGIL